ncbi:MAG: gamma-glutamylcyclotransferase family protein [Stappiaceae bacterium]
MKTRFCYFGYGSLVNGQTRPATSSASAGILRGWKRQWRIAGQTPRGKICTLTAVPDATSSIRGVLVEEELKELADLDKREWRYNRHDFQTSDFSPDGADFNAARHQSAYIYSAKEDQYRWGDEDHPILQSYVDCVLKGFHDLWGELGVRHFVEETEGWHVPMLSDRHNPVYPRAAKLTAQESDFFDTALREIGARWL